MHQSFFPFATCKLFEGRGIMLQGYTITYIAICGAEDVLQNNSGSSNNFNVQNSPLEGATCMQLKQVPLDISFRFL